VSGDFSRTEITNRAGSRGRFLAGARICRHGAAPPPSRTQGRHGGVAPIAFPAYLMSDIRHRVRKNEISPPMAG
jgi:hypothetical protein